MKKLVSLETTDIILPKRRKYYIETMSSHYEHTLPAEHLEETRRIIRKLQPEYLPAFDEVMHCRSGHMFNMFIMKQSKFDEYCAWLFPILDELTKYIELLGTTHSTLGIQVESASYFWMFG